jgi:hypothetical protein
MLTQRARHRRGIGAAYAIMLLVALIAIASLAVDWGRVQLVKTQLQTAADAAARAGGLGMRAGIPQARTDAMNVAAANAADGSSVTLNADNDIEFGAWDPGTRTFTVLTGAAADGANAIRVTARRTAATGNAVPLLWGRLIGRETCDAQASAVAAIASTGYGIVGLDHINMGGNATDSYWSETGTTSPDQGSVASNSDITLSGSSAIHGSANPGVGHTVVGASHVTGNTDPLAFHLYYPTRYAGAYATTNNNDLIPSWAMASRSLHIPANKTVTIPGGIYFLENFNVGKNNTVDFTGPATIYVYGSVNFSGNATTSGNLPDNLKIITVPNPNTGAPPGPINLSSNSALYAGIYAPLSPVTMSGTGDLYGSIVAKSIDMTGTSAIHYDLSLPGFSGPVSLVK